MDDKTLREIKTIASCLRRDARDINDGLFAVGINKTLVDAANGIDYLLTEVERLQTELDAANERNTFKVCEMIDGQPHCPKCGEDVAGYYSDYCEHCGQALSLPPE